MAGAANDCSVCALERYGMVMLIVGALVAVGVWIGWFGYKASLRIQAWGRRMDDLDEIFRRVTGAGDANPEDVRRQIPRVLPFVRSHVGHRAVGSK